MAYRCSGARSTFRPDSIAWHFSIASSTSFPTSAAECGDSLLPAKRLASMALMISACSDGSCSSRYIATCSSLALRISGRRMNQPRSASAETPMRILNVMMEPGLNRQVSSPHAESTSVRTPSPSTPTAPRSSSL